MTIHNQWQIFKGESKACSNLLYTVKSNSMFKSKTKLDIFLAGSGTCDYKVRGNWTDGSCEVYAGRTSSSLVATMSRKVSDGTQSEGDDELTITVYPHVDFLFIISLVLILDKIDRDTAAAAHQSYADPVGIL
uniref:Uncharacterized protein n=1 Tax=Kalanchoe fedtschenkoi TaxID=63787 RepID=A0A7N0UYB2_KALFE